MRTVAYMWRCGDICMCARPRIASIGDDGLIGRIYFEGTFMSGYGPGEGYEEESAQLDQELAEAAERFGVEIDRSIS